MVRFTPKGYTALTLLIIMTIFLVGVQTGKSIQGIDNTYSVPSQNPPQQPTPTLISFKTIKECGVSFLLPSQFNRTLTNPSRYAYRDEFVEVDCQNLLKLDAKALVRLKTITINSQSVEMFKLNDARVWTIKSESTTKVGSPSATTSPRNITFRASQNISELVQRTVTY